MPPVLRVGLLSLVLAACEPTEAPSGRVLGEAPAASGGAATVPVTGSVRTAAPSFRVREWTVDDGLPTPVAAVTQTPDGYLWITTREGLARFDGVRFELFTTETTPVFRSDDFVGASVTRSGDLWVGDKKKWTYRLRDGAWTAYPLDMDRHWVQSFYEDAEGGLWCVTSGEYVFRWKGEGWEPVEQSLIGNWPPFSVDPRGSIWTYLDPGDAPGVPESATGKGVVARWDGERFVPPSDNRLAGFTETQHGPVFYQRTEEQRDGRPRVNITDASGAVLAWGWDKGDDSRVRLVDRAGRAWVQREEDGQTVLTVLRDGEELAHIRPEGATWFEQVFEDRQGNVWVHTRSTGLFQITEEPFRRYTGEDGIPQYASEATLAPDGAIVVSAHSGTASSFATLRDGVVAPEAVRLSPAPGRAAEHTAPDGTTEIGHVVTDARGQRWGAVKPYLLRLREGRGEIVMSTGNATLWAMQTDPTDADVLWTGDYSGVVRRFDTRALAVTDSFQVDGWVRALYPAPDGRLWIGSTGGLTVREASGALRVVADSSVAMWTRDITPGPDGALWVATETGGLLRVRGGEVRALTTQHGLPTDFLTTVLLDDLGYLWLSGRVTLYRLRLSDAHAVLDGTRQRLDVVTLLPSAGHLGSSAEMTRSLHAPDGSLWIPSYKGVTRIDPALYAQQYAQPASVIVEEIETEASGAFKPARGLRLPLGERTLTVRYTATEFVSPGHVRFRTRLEGHDADWVDQGTERRAIYGGLAPGRYAFHVQAMNAGGVWSEPLAAEAFVVPARFTETAWFAVLCLLALGGLAALAYGARVRVLRQRQRELEATVAERTADLAAEKEIVTAQAAELRTLDEAKSRLFANVSHEFRTPLQLILGPLADVREGRHGEVAPQARDQIDLATRNGRRLLALVEQLLALARSDAGVLEIEPVWLDAAAFAVRVAEAFGPLAQREGIAFETDLPAARGTFDPVLVETALANLLANAFSFTPAGGTVTLSLTPEAAGEPLAFRVRDTGPGLAPDQAARVFDRFYQADDSPTRRGAGTGIGLALVREIADLHGGAITVTSTPGQGATFTLTLPVHAEAPEGATRRASGEPGLQTAALLFASGDGSSGDGSARNRASGDGRSGDGRLHLPPLPPEAPADTPRVLVVDDNADLRALVRRHLDSRYVVTEAASGDAALDLARGAIPDAIVSDVMMPGLDGLGLVRALRADPETDFVPVLLLTARAAVSDTVDGLGAGADDYLAKPFDPRELRARVDALLTSRQRLRERWQDAAPEAEPFPVRLASGASADQRELVGQLVGGVDARLDDESLSVDDLAEAVDMSRSTLYRRLRGALDGSPVDLVREVRLARAGGLLARGAGNVSEVAYAVGFKSVSHFGACFRERYGATPSAYSRDQAAA
ncbi:ATP-binding protein [Rubricoccus marinus]|uniref:histidine kinase n=1 Tax=Rubricoccus marinus TaxID=716817 RepID=A0A259TV80_9BACT|nr:ATP-binding protein [Rubricoccus marinus]OZC01606.1 hypothetical protein BSZ36_00570 [Rubricoccus marinus]